jgi:lipopolysaccharide transport system ATP-binding protein
MTNPTTAIRAEHLGKRYMLRKAIVSQDGMLREAIINGMRSSARQLRTLGRRAGGRAGGREGNPKTEAFWALRDVSFDIKSGEATGIIGRNGAGKSTLLKILSRITEPTEGQVELHGRVGSLLEVGTGFHPELSGRENIFLSGAILGMPRSEIVRQYDQIVDFAGIEQFLETPVKRYSSGMYIRLAFAVAAHLEPEILLIDEVLAVGDIEFQQKCLGKMGDVAKGGRTVLFVSHNMAAVESLCSRGIYLERGQVKFAGTSKETIAAYLADQKSGMRQRTDGVVAATEDRSAVLLNFSPVDKNGAPLAVVRSGEDLRLAATLQLTKPVPRAAFYVDFDDIYGTRVTVLYSDIAGYPLNLEPGTHRIVVEAPRLQLPPGSYNLYVQLRSGGGSIFRVLNPDPLFVESGDFFGSGKLPDASWGGFVYLPQHWEVASIAKEPQ